MEIPEKKKKFEEKIKGLFPDSYEAVLQNMIDPKPTTFRINTIKSTPEKVLSQLNVLGYKVDEGPIEKSYVVVEAGTTRLSVTEAFLNGELYIQSLSSMIPVPYLNISPNDKVLDLCAAPGSKTSQIAVESNNSAQITAVETNRSRFFALKDNLENQGVKNVTLLLENSKFIHETHPEFIEYFDKVLIDAPCSNEGRICLIQPQTFKTWNPKIVKHLPKLQKSLLAAGIKCLKPGGRLVYSTCTFSKEENEDVVEWALKKFPEMTMLESRRIVPDKFFTGFFFAVLVKSD